jgi:hypothetical protein
MFWLEFFSILLVFFSGRGGLECSWRGLDAGMVLKLVAAFKSLLALGEGIVYNTGVAGNRDSSPECYISTQVREWIK